MEIALNRVSRQDFNARLGTTDYPEEFIGKLKKQCKNVKLRHIYFRLVSKDFFTVEEMIKCKMVNSDKCSRCGEVESYRHLFWDCRKARKYGGHIVSTLCIENEDLQEMIQSEGLVNRLIEKIIKIATDIKNVELYNSALMHRRLVTRFKWDKIVQQEKRFTCNLLK
jgi:hypothetical protein